MFIEIPDEFIVIQTRILKLSYLVSQGQPKLTKVKRLFFQDGMEVKTIDDIEHDAELWMRKVFK